MTEASGHDGLGQTATSNHKQTLPKTMKAIVIIYSEGVRKPEGEREKERETERE